MSCVFNAIYSWLLIHLICCIINYCCANESLMSVPRFGTINQPSLLQILLLISASLVKHLR